jgi:hypothetical protein
MATLSDPWVVISTIKALTGEGYVLQVWSFECLEGVQMPPSLHWRASFRQLPTTLAHNRALVNNSLIGIILTALARRSVLVNHHLVCVILTKFTVHGRVGTK